MGHSLATPSTQRDSCSPPPTPAPARDGGRCPEHVWEPVSRVRPRSRGGVDPRPSPGLREGRVPSVVHTPASVAALFAAREFCSSF